MVHSVISTMFVLSAAVAASTDQVLLQAHLLKARMSAASGTQGPSDALQAVLDQHNVYRCMHGLADFAWDDTIAANAQQYATSTGGQMQHSSSESRSGVAGFNYLGENLAWGVTNAKAVELWYDEIKYTDGGLVSSFSSNTGHYTQVVWKGTTHIGCGIERTLLVCQYGEGGNMQGQFDTQVTAPVRSAAECRGSSGGSDSSAATPAPSPAGGGDAASEGGSAAPSGGGTCSRDDNEHCSAWASQGFCASSSSHHQYMMAHCCATCASSTGGSGSTSGTPSGGSSWSWGSSSGSGERGWSFWR